jgi:putative flippase GtrA
VSAKALFQRVFDPVFFRFILVGIANTLFGAALMFSLFNLAGCSYWVSSAANYFFGSILSFFLNKYFTFKEKQWSVRMIAAFGFTIIISYLAAYGTAKPAVSFLLRNQPERIRDNLALLAGMCLFTALNYLGQRFVAFRTKPAVEGTK